MRGRRGALGALGADAGRTSRARRCELSPPRRAISGRRPLKPRRGERGGGGEWSGEPPGAKTGSSQQRRLISRYLILRRWGRVGVGGVSLLVFVRGNVTLQFPSLITFRPKPLRSLSKRPLGAVSEQLSDAHFIFSFADLVWGPCCFLCSAFLSGHSLVPFP